MLNILSPSLSLYIYIYIYIYIHVYVYTQQPFIKLPCGFRQYLARGVKLNAVLLIEGFLEIIVGEIVVKSTYES